MNKIATFINHFRGLGATYAQSVQQQGLEKNAFLGKLIPKTRLGRLGAGVAGATGLGALYKGMQDEPGMLENAVEGGKDMLSNMTQEDLMNYAHILGATDAGYNQMGYAPTYDEMAMEYPDLGGTMGYSAPMTPEEEQAYLAYYGG